MPTHSKARNIMQLDVLNVTSILRAHFFFIGDG